MRSAIAGRHRPSASAISSSQSSRISAGDEEDEDRPAPGPGRPRRRRPRPRRWRLHAEVGQDREDHRRVGGAALGHDPDVLEAVGRPDRGEQDDDQDDRGGCAAASPPEALPGVGAVDLGRLVELARARVCRAARKEMHQKGKPRQTVATITAGIAVERCPSQSIDPGVEAGLGQDRLMPPPIGMKSSRQTRKATNPGIAQGSRMNERKSPRPRTRPLEDVLAGEEVVPRRAIMRVLQTRPPTCEGARSMSPRPRAKTDRHGLGAGTCAVERGRTLEGAKWARGRTDERPGGGCSRARRGLTAAATLAGLAAPGLLRRNHAVAMSTSTVRATSPTLTEIQTIL